MPADATIVITAALALYTIGVWSERFAGRLKPWHLAFFWSGLVFDTAGTGMMLEYAGGLTADLHGITGVIAIVLMAIHGITGVIAIVLMAIHAAWATVVLARRDERWIRSFHRFSVVVWAIWLVPYFSPMFVAIAAP